MFIRRERKTTRDGQARIHVSLAHNVREVLPDGRSRPKPIILARLGREDLLDADTVVQMRDALNRYLRERFGDEAADEKAMTNAVNDLKYARPALKMLASRAYGMRVVVEAVWEGLGLKKVLQQASRKHKVTFDFERVVFAMVLNRLIDPTSKRACNEWVQNEAWFPEHQGMEVQHFYRALDLMDKHADALMAAIGRAARDATDTDELALLLVDTTTSYSESEFDDAERKQILEEWRLYLNGEGDKPTMPFPQVTNDPPLRMRGHSKDKRPREPQVKVGLVTTNRGRVVDVQTHAGNLSDQALTLGLLTAAQARLPGHRLVAVMDSGMGGNPNLKAIDQLEPKIDRVSAVPYRNSKVAEQALLAKSGRWKKHPYRPDFSYRDVVLDAESSPSGRAERWVATRNEVEARRQKRLLDKEVARIRAALEEDNRVDGHGRPVCALLSNSKRRRYLTKNAKGDRFVLNPERVRLEQRRAGVHVVRSTLTEEPVEATLRAYDAQYGIESEFRALKTPLKLRPMHHRASRRIQAHILMCALALMVMRELERQTGQTLRDVQRAVGRVRAVQVQQGMTRFWQREEWSDDAVAVLKAVGAKPGPTTWGAKRVAP